MINKCSRRLFSQRTAKLLPLPLQFSKAESHLLKFFMGSFYTFIIIIHTICRKLWFDFYIFRFRITFCGSDFTNCNGRYIFREFILVCWSWAENFNFPKFQFFTIFNLLTANVPINAPQIDWLVSIWWEHWSLKGWAILDQFFLFYFSWKYQIARGFVML